MITNCADVLTNYLQAEQAPQEYKLPIIEKDNKK
jgi:hypothetical protein